MRLVLTLLVRDEEDIVRDTIEFHLRQGVDHVVATDNNSVDGTREILSEYQRLGVLELIDEPGDDYSQSRWVTRMARLAATELGADWVINSDADEFWWPKSGDLKTALSKIGGNVDAVAAKRTDFPPRPDGHPWFAERMQVRETRSFNNLGFPLPDKICHRARAAVDVGQGNDTVSFASRPANIASERPITVFHFPLRTPRQFENKISNGGAAYRRNFTLTPEIGATWRKLYEIYLRGDLDEYYRSKIVDDEGATRGILNGTHVLERRLHHFLTNRPELASFA